MRDGGDWPDGYGFAPRAPLSTGARLLAECHSVFRRWLGESYDIGALNAVMAAAAAEQLGGDPLWLQVVSGSGNAKTETVNALSGVGAIIISTITSDAALLSGSPSKQRAKDATGGLLRKLGDSGLLVIKDVTSILSMNRDARASVLAALREIHDGHWVRNLGTDGGQTLSWTGRCAVIGAVTTAWDAAHSVIAAMGDRFLLVRMDSTKGRADAGRQSRRNVGHEEQMRRELSAAVGRVINGMDTVGGEISDADAEILLAAADLVTLARTGVEYDYRGDVIDAHAPEMPTRFMKQLVQVVRGGLAIGMTHEAAMRLARRCARDSMSPLRLACIDDLAAHPGSTATDVRKRIDKPRNTVDRQLQALHMLGVLALEEEEQYASGTRWRYSLVPHIDPTAIHVPDLLEDMDDGTENKALKGRTSPSLSLTTDISGTSSRPCSRCSDAGCTWCAA